jgi:hypothetical protein
MRAIAATMTMAVMVLGAGAGAAHADPGKHAMKGWELYTWFDLSCSASAQLHSAPNPDSWCAALVVGTNRLKTAGEIKKTPMKWRELATALGGLRAGEPVVWITTPGTFDRPGSPLRDPIDALAKRRGLTLTPVERK